MGKWIIDAFVSMLFAGFTSVIAKMGLVGMESSAALIVAGLLVIAKNSDSLKLQIAVLIRPSGYCDRFHRLNVL
jgi:uncharacterized membrane protein